MGVFKNERAMRKLIWLIKKTYQVEFKAIRCFKQRNQPTDLSYSNMNFAKLALPIENVSLEIIWEDNDQYSIIRELHD